MCMSQWSQGRACGAVQVMSVAWTGTGVVRAGWVYRVGNTEVQPTDAKGPAARGDPQIPAKRAPEAPGGLEWVGIWGSDVLDPYLGWCAPGP